MSKDNKTSLEDDNVKKYVVELSGKNWSQREIARSTGIPKSTIGDFLRKETYTEWWEQAEDFMGSAPKILTFDIETAPNRAWIWSSFTNYVPVDRFDREWYIMSWAAKWFGEDNVMYQDKRDSWNTEDDTELVKAIWELLNECDIVVTQNGDKFDIKKLNSRFLKHGLKPPRPYKSVDLLKVDKRRFAHTSNKLSYKTDTFNKKYKKLDHEKFPGNKLWDECLLGNQEAWQEMEDYNIHDVLSTEELYTIYLPWIDNHPNINLYYKDNITRCTCGSTNFERDGFVYTNLSKFDNYRCMDCGSNIRGRTNLIPKDKRQSLKMNIIQK